MTKSIKFTILAAILLVGIVGLNTVMAAPLPQTESKLFPYSADSLTYGFVDEAGEWVIEPEFDFAGEFVEGLAVIEQDGQYGYIDPSGDVVVEPQYDFAFDFSEGLAPVAVDGEAGYIDQTGAMVIEPQFDDARPFTAEGLAVVRMGQNYGYIDQEGQFVIDPQFESAFSFSDGLAAVAVDGEYGYIDESGTVVIQPQFDFAAGFSEGLAAVLINGQMGFINEEGELVIEPIYNFAQDFSEGLAAVSVDGQVGFIDETGAMVIEPQFNYAENFSEGLAAVRVDDLIGFIDETGAMVIEPQFDDARAFQDGLARVEQANEWGYIDPSGALSFMMPVSAASLDSTLIIPFLPGVPAETRAGICLTQSSIIPDDFAWRCVVESDEPDEISIYDPCLVANDGQTLVCGADPLVGDPGFKIDLVEPLPDQAASAEADSENHAWLVQLADGAVCQFVVGVTSTIDGQRSNYICSDSSVLLGDLQPGTVWQADQIALGDIVRTDEGYTAEEITPAEIAVVWQPVGPEAVLEEIGLTAGQLSIDPTGVAETIRGEIRPAVPYVPELSDSLDGEPAHLRFTFDDEDLSELGGVSQHQAQLLIYPVEAYQAIYEDAEDNVVSQRIEALQTLLQDRPESVEDEIPVLPGFGNAEQMIKAGIKYLDFDGGSGIRFITHYGLGTTPITEHGVFYTFQGLTDDGQYYVAYYHPAPSTLLPGDFESVEGLIEDYDAFEADFETYLQEINDQLDTAETSAFTPNLTDIDAMLESLQIGP
ncbi:MAG: WG repeat-containing protein [Anaerolineae bacterium]|nr:WG repeat-containing protein [Anaerolineae bacterium]